MLVVERCYNGIHFLFLSRKNVAFSNLRLQAVSVVVYVAFEMGLFKGPKCCPRGVYRKQLQRTIGICYYK